MALFAGFTPTSLIATAIVAGLVFAAAPALAELVVRLRADRLPGDLSSRLFEEWLSEVRTLDSRLEKLQFALGLLTIRNSALVDADTEHREAPYVVVSQNVTVYSDSWSRFWALLIDGLIFLFAVLVAGLVISRVLDFGRYFQLRARLVLEPIWTVSWLLFILHFSASPGKLMMGLRIIGADGTRLSLRRLLLREAPNYIPALVSAAVLTLASSHSSPANFDAMSVRDQTAFLDGSLPLWWPMWRGFLQIFGLGELAAFFSTDERRALHDFIAGTVVVAVIPQVIAQPDALPPARSTSSLR